MGLYLKYRWEIYKLNRLHDKIDKEFREKIKIARKKEKSKQEIEDLDELWGFEHSIVEGEINYIITKILRQKANRYNLPLPSHDDEDSWSHNVDGQRYLRYDAQYKIAKQIRQELKERIEIWIPIITALTGLIGVFIGLISILFR